MNIRFLLISVVIVLFSSCSILSPRIIAKRYCKYNGELITNFEIYNTHDSLINAKNFFNNKVVYLSIGEIDCIDTKEYYKSALPKLIRLYENFDSLLFINILIEKDKQKWDSYMERHNPPGLNFRFSGDKKELIKIFHSDYLPIECIVNRNFTFAGYDLCGMGREAAPFFALHYKDLKSGLKETIKLTKYDFITVNYYDEFIKSQMDKKYSYNNFLYNKLLNDSISTPSDSAISSQILKKEYAENMIDTLLSQNKGKVIYIDFWATWCSPCRKEMEYSHGLYSQLDSSKVSFIYICLDSDFNQYKTYIKEGKLPGEHIYIDKEQSKLIRKKYKIESIPYYLLYDQKGIIKNKGNTIRPSNPETEKEIKQIITGA